MPYKGHLAPFVFQLVGGLRAGMGYCGCKTLEELRTKARFIQVTAASVQESHPHDIAITQEAPNYSSAEARWGRRVGSPCCSRSSGGPASARSIPAGTAALQPARQLAGRHLEPYRPRSTGRVAATRTADPTTADRPSPTDAEGQSGSRRRSTEPKYVRLPAAQRRLRRPERRAAGTGRSSTGSARTRKRGTKRDPFAKYPKDADVPAAPAGRRRHGVSSPRPPITRRCGSTTSRSTSSTAGCTSRRRTPSGTGGTSGIIQPLVSAAYFYKDVLLWPNSLASGVRLRLLGHERRQVPAGQPDAVHALPAGADHHRHRRAKGSSSPGSRSRFRDRTVSGRQAQVDGLARLEACDSTTR